MVVEIMIVMIYPGTHESLEYKLIRTYLSFVL